jgi:uncharacterized membrane protein
MVLLQDHVSFTLMLLVPFYWLLNWLTGTYTLAIVQLFIILAGGLALYKLLYLKTSSQLLSILALLQYFTLYGRWASFYTPFNIAIVAASAIPVFLYYFEKRKFIAAWLVIVFILLAREDMALWLIFIGLFLLIEHFKEKDLRKVSIFIILVSLAYFTFIFSVFLPMIETSHAKYILFNFSALGNNPPEALLFILKHPIRSIELLFINHSGNSYNDGVKIEFFYVYMLYGGFLLFTKPKYLLLFIPLVLKKMYNDLPIRWSIESFYSIEFVSMLPIAVFLIISQIKRKIIRNLIISIVCLNTVGITIYKLLEKDRPLNFDNVNFTFFRKSMYTSPYPVAEIHKYLDLIPPDAPVSSSGTINPHLAFRQADYYFPRVDDATYIAVFNGKDTWPMTLDEFKANINIYLLSPDWEKIVDDGYILILKKKVK